MDLTVRQMYAITPGFRGFLQEATDRRQSTVGKM